MVIEGLGAWASLVWAVLVGGYSTVHFKRTLDSSSRPVPGAWQPEGLPTSGLTAPHPGFGDLKKVREPHRAGIWGGDWAGGARQGPVAVSWFSPQEAPALPAQSCTCTASAHHSCHHSLPSLSFRQRLILIPQLEWVLLREAMEGLESGNPVS